ncbi:hypothetical protein V3G39_10025 [Dermatophilaceae bacterium Sec6.4]
MSSSTLSLTIVILLVLLIAVVVTALKIVKQYEEGVLFCLGRVVGQHTLDETLSETDRINMDIRAILDVSNDHRSARTGPEQCGLPPGNATFAPPHPRRQMQGAVMTNFHRDAVPLHPVTHHHRRARTGAFTLHGCPVTRSR